MQEYCNKKTCRSQRKSLANWPVRPGSKEKLERSARARTKEEKTMAKERRKVKEASAKMELHKAKARHAEKKLGAKLPHEHGVYNYHHPPAAAQHDHQHQHGHHRTTI